MINMQGIPPMCFLACFQLLLIFHSSSAAYTLVPDVGYYKLHTSSIDWRTAQHVCRLEGTNLVVLNSKQEKGAVIQLLLTHPDIKYVHSGFHDLFVEGLFVTVTGEELAEYGYVEWESAAPVGSTGYNCGSVSRSGLLADQDCSLKLPFICENSLWSEYEFFLGIGYYKLYVRGENWMDAKKKCKDDGAHLAVINSPEEAEVLKKLVSRYPTLNNTDHDDRVLLGYHLVYDVYTSHSTLDFRTVQGQSLNSTGYMNWKKDQPIIGRNWHCGGITRSAELVMITCSHKYAFLCEHEL